MLVIFDNSVIQCPECKSFHVMHNGNRVLSEGKIKKQFKCQEIYCNKSFIYTTIAQRFADMSNLRRKLSSIKGRVTILQERKQEIEKMLLQPKPVKKSKNQNIYYDQKTRGDF